MTEIACQSEPDDLRQRLLEPSDLFPRAVRTPVVHNDNLVRIGGDSTRDIRHNGRERGFLVVRRYHHRDDRIDHAAQYNVAARLLWMGTP